MTEPSAKPATILVVDDHAATRKLICRIVRGLGFHTLEAENGLEAIRLYGVHSDQIAAATLDLAMPVAGGRSALMMLSELAPFLPIVVATGLDPKGQDLQGRVPGTPGVAFLPKPFDKAQFKAALDKVMGEIGRK